jgi:hypothetical protein
MYDIINTERGERNPKRKEYIIMKNINEMNREELDKAIAEIENDPKYISARMADRLEGEEKAYYNKQFNTLLELNRARANKRTKEEYAEMLEDTLETLSNLNRSLAEDNLDAFRKYTLKQTIASFEKTAENYRRRIAEAE